MISPKRNSCVDTHFTHDAFSKISLDMAFTIVDALPA